MRPAGRAIAGVTGFTGTSLDSRSMKLQPSLLLRLGFGAIGSMH
jgi:hypothetical protein